MTLSPEPIEATTPITVYGHPFCGQVPPTLAMLKSVGARFEYIDIYKDDEARAFVAQVNHGNLSVPTLRFADNTTLTEPSAGQLRSRLKELGYNVPAASWLLGNLHLIIIAIIIVFALLRFLEIL